MYRARRPMIGAVTWFSSSSSRRKSLDAMTCTSPRAAAVGSMKAVVPLIWSA
jgi:hypothetical protein